MYLKKKYIRDYWKTPTILSFMVVFFVWVFSIQGLNAQVRQGPFTLDGVVHSITKVPVMDARVLVQESTTFAVTDEFGNFTIEIPAPNTIITIEADGFLPKSITIADGKFLEVELEYAPEGQSLKDKVFVPWGVSDKRSVTSSVSTTTQAELRKSPVIDLTGAISGRLPGFTVVQDAQSPGWEDAEIRIRGIRTLETGGWNAMSKGGVGTPIVIVDGFERGFTDLDASEIESFSVLKDAAATAIYGVRGANGVILVNTKRGQANKRTIDLEISTGIVTPMRLPEFLGSYDYATLYNEALANDGLPPVYTADDLEKYRTGSSPLTHPDVDFYDEFIRDYTFQRKAALTMSGGNRLVRYFVSVINNNLSSLYNRMDENPEFKCFSRVGMYNLRANLDVTLTKRFTAKLNLGGRVEDREYPFGTDVESNLFNELANVPPNAYPISFMGIDPSLNKEIFMLGGSALYTTNPLGRLSFRGQSERMWRIFQMGMSFRHELDFITPGLAVNFQFDADGSNYYRVSRYKAYIVWDRVEMPDNSIVYVPYNEPTSLTTEVGTDVEYYNGQNLHLTYDRQFGDHSFNGLAMWRRYTVIMKQANQPDVKREDFALRMNYSFANR
jgi:TonB-linked SusC/RagA family outer membrane protein